MLLNFLHVTEIAIWQLNIMNKLDTIMKEYNDWKTSWSKKKQKNYNFLKTGVLHTNSFSKKVIIKRWKKLFWDFWDGGHRVSTSDEYWFFLFLIKNSSIILFCSFLLILWRSTDKLANYKILETCKSTDNVIWTGVP